MRSPEQLLRTGGGTDPAPLSCTTELATAASFATSRESLLLLVNARSFMQRGASIGFLSAFPAEEEVLYPPLTFLKPTGKRLTLTFQGCDFTVVEVVPQFGT